MKLETALASCGGAARRRQLLALGVSRHRLDLARKGDLAISEGAYALPGTPLPLVTAVRLGGVVSHASAADLHGLALWTPRKKIHVTVPTWRSPEPGVELHRARLSTDDLDTFRPLTSLLRTATDCGRTMPLLEAVVVLDCVTHRGWVPAATLRAAANAARGHGAAALRQAMRFVEELAESPIESVLRMLVNLLDCEIRVGVLRMGPPWLRTQ